MRIKNKGFFRKVRLCLCLIWGFGLLGCSVLKQEPGSAKELKSYRIWIDRLPGEDQSTLIAALDGTVITAIEPLAFTGIFKELPEEFTLSVKVNDEAALQRVLSRLQSSGFRVRNATIQN